MSLDTILKIGKALRNSEDNLKYFKYTGSLKADIKKRKENEYQICITIPVKEDFSFDWDKMYLTPENEYNKLFYFKYETSNNDSSPKKFLFGDITYSRKNGIDKSGKIKKTGDYGNFTLERGNAINNSEKIINDIRLNLFEERIKEKIKSIGTLKEQNALLKQLVKSFKTDNSVIQLPEKLEKYKDETNALYKVAREKINGIALFKFYNSLKAKNEISLILKYAPAFNKLLSESESILTTTYLSDKTKLINEYYKAVINQLNTKVLKKLLKENEEIKNISETTKNKIVEYADFNVFIHFDFQGKSWYDFKDSFDLLIQNLNSMVTDDTDYGKVPSKAIYRTLCSGNEKNDIQFPNFRQENRHKSFVFNNNEFIDFLYSESFVENPLRKISGSEIEFYVLPVSINENREINAEDYDEFLRLKDEARIKMYEKENDNEPIFSFFDEEQINFTKFDFIFTDGSGNSKTDLIEISGIEQSKLKQISERIRVINNQVKEEKKKYLKTQKEQYNFKIENSFKNVLGNYYFDEKTKRITIKPSSKYKTHLLKVLPLIYKENYFNDEILLPAFIQNVETSVRFGDPKYAFLKFDLMFLYRIQNSQKDKYMEITNSKSYKLGLLLGKLAKNLTLEINSFEKNYVGNLSRRISSLSDFIKLKNDIEQKLIMHDKTKFTYQTSYELAQEIKNFTETYDKEESAFGFLESYFEPIPKKQD